MRSLSRLPQILIANLLLICSSCSSVNETPDGIGTDGLRISRFPQAEGDQLTATENLSCSIYLKLSEGDADYIMLTSHPDQAEKTFMKVNGEWVKFYGILEQTRFPPPWRDQVSKDGSLILDLNLTSDETTPAAMKFSIKLQDESGRKIYLEPEVANTDC
ncbi:MAG: hypothetical protein AAGF01_27305 [Cyanobacteria bacterium P01_G01_bin.38]